jgi:signal transduction histidine kinase
MDIGMAVVLLGFTVGSFVIPDSGPNAREATVFAYVLGVLGTLPLVWRRRRPIAVLVATGACAALAEALRHPDSTLGVVPLVAAYSVAAYTRSRRALRITATIVVAGVVIANLVSAFVDRKPENLLAGVGNGIIFATAFLAGDNIRRRRERLADLEARADAEETTRRALAREAVAAERQRIARELHDVVAHSLSVMVVQAGAARRLVTTKPDRAAEALGAIETTGREALDEMRRLLGVLRASDGAPETPDLAPQPSLVHLDDLTRADPGLPVDVVVDGQPAPLPAAIDLQAYRIVQEALTNVRKHAGPARATVHLHYGTDALEVRVDDDGRGASASPPSDGGGHGLVGMRERAALCGGELRAGPRPGGGWSVTARLPLAGTRSGAA